MRQKHVHVVVVAYAKVVGHEMNVLGQWVRLVAEKALECVVGVIGLDEKVVVGEGTGKGLAQDGDHVIARDDFEVPAGVVARGHLLRTVVIERDVDLGQLRVLCKGVDIVPVAGEIKLQVVRRAKAEEDGSHGRGRGLVCLDQDDVGDHFVRLHIDGRRFWLMLPSCPGSKKERKKQFVFLVFFFFASR